MYYMYIYSYIIIYIIYIYIISRSVVMKNIYSLSGWMVYGILLWIRTHHGDTDWAKSIVAIATSHCDCLQRRSNCLVRELFWLLQMEKSWMLWVSLWICTLLLCVCVMNGDIAIQFAIPTHIMAKVNGSYTMDTYPLSIHGDIAYIPTLR